LIQVPLVVWWDLHNQVRQQAETIRQPGLFSSKFGFRNQGILW